MCKERRLAEERQLVTQIQLLNLEDTFGLGLGPGGPRAAWKGGASVRVPRSNLCSVEDVILISFRDQSARKVYSGYVV